MRALDRQWFSGPESEIAPSEEATARKRSAAVRRLDALRPLTSVLTTKDHALLEGHLLQPGPQDGPAALPLDMMRIKLADARLVLSQNVDPDIATADSRVVYATDRRPAQTAILVHWEHELTRDIALPVTTPLGLALLGLKAGQSAPYLRSDGSVGTATLEAVAYQPEAARRVQRRDAGSAQPTTIAHQGTNQG